MTVHLIKLCVGAQTIADLAGWQSSSRRHWRTAGGRQCVFHTTLQTPTRKSELLEGGSLYWVIKGQIEARQALVGFEDGHKEDGSPCCLILLDPAIVPVKPVVRRPFQGWRYLSSSDCPPDLSSNPAGGLASFPPALRRDLAELCLI